MATTAPGLRYSLTQGKKSMTAAMQKASRSSVALALRRSSNSSACSNNSNNDNKIKSSASAMTTDQHKPHHDPSSNNNSSHNPADDDVNSSSNNKSKSSNPNNSSNRQSSSATTTAGSPAVPVYPTDMTKIFVLLLEPKTKTFELIQLVYPSATTTIGDILRMIPRHATEMALGAQRYLGLCRPKDKESLSDLSLLASPCMSRTATTTTTNNNKNAGVCAGEILVAIPGDYGVAEVTKFSQAILSNKRFTKLLRRSNPLAPMLRKHSDRKKDRSSKSHRHRHRSRDAVHILEDLEEGDENDEQMMQRALEKAATAAAQANANIPASSATSPTSSTSSKENNSNGNSTSISPLLQSPDMRRHSPQNNNNKGGSPTRSSKKRDPHSDIDSIDSSLGTSRGSYTSSYAASSWVAGGASIYSTSSAGDSLGESVRSWSQSLDASFSSGPGRPKYARHRNMPGTPGSRNAMMCMEPNSFRRRDPQPSMVRKFLLVGMCAMGCGLYFMGCYLPMEVVVSLHDTPLGFLGMVQVLFFLLILKKIQFLATRQQRRMNAATATGTSPTQQQPLPPPPKSMRQSGCPAVRLYAKLVGMK